MGKGYEPDLSTLTKQYRFIKRLDNCSSQRHEDILYLRYVEGKTMEEISRELDIYYKNIYGMKKKALKEQRKAKGKICTGAKDYLERMIRDYIRARRLKKLLQEYEKQGKDTRSIRKTIIDLEERCKEKQEKIMQISNELYQDILYMKYVEGYEVEDIAYDLGKQEKAIYEELNKAIQYFAENHMSPQ